MKNFCNILFVSIILSACGKYQQVLKSTDLEYKFEMAKKYYDEKQYFSKV